MAPRHLRQKKEARSILKSSVLMLFNSRADFKLKPNVRAEPKQQEDGCVLRQDQDGAHKSSHSFRQVLAGLAGGLVRRNSDCVSLDSLRTALPRARSVSFDEVVKVQLVLIFNDGRNIRLWIIVELHQERLYDTPGPISRNNISCSFPYMLWCKDEKFDSSNRQGLCSVPCPLKIA